MKTTVTFTDGTKREITVIHADKTSNSTKNHLGIMRETRKTWQRSKE